jgi:hypothetical protein
LSDAGFGKRILKMRRLAFSLFRHRPNSKTRQFVCLSAWSIWFVCRFHFSHCLAVSLSF